MSSFALVGCANTDVFSGSVYSGEQAKEARSIAYGTIVSVRDVKIQARSEGVIGTVGGGVLGGVAGNAIGGGTGQAIATAVGAVAGAVIGNQVEQKRVKFLHWKWLFAKMMVKKSWSFKRKKTVLCLANV